MNSESVYVLPAEGTYWPEYVYADRQTGERVMKVGVVHIVDNSGECITNHEITIILKPEAYTMARIDRVVHRFAYEHGTHRDAKIRLEKLVNYYLHLGLYRPGQGIKFTQVHFPA